MNIEIAALDTLFFRDAKPFERGSENWATGVFPPMPSVFYGALRSAFLGQNSQNKIESNIIASESLVINSLLLKNFSREGDEDEIILPIPLDLISFKDSDESKLLDYCKNDFVSSKGKRFDGFLRSYESEKTEELAGKAFLKKLDFLEYLKGNQDTFNSIKIQENTTLEPKIGIGRDNNTNVADTGLLYRVGMVRPVKEDNVYNFLREFKFVIDFEFKENINILAKGLLKLGGENKVASYATTTKDNIFNCPEITSNYFKVYLSTPAIFENGWYPKIFENKILTCAVGKPQMIGGFDINKKMPKVMQKAVPAGSVYYIKVETNKEAKELIQKLHGNSISEYKKEEGFGICYVAKISQTIN
ncbi:CRISPR-associated protein, Cmr3 family [Bernardetia litoralis DSM 6794]|uniref:CRISPR-associated protein, Cmr3 family n=1 Tax=Bernardetia litoralis (strain ATCC 23117 / DSM 6794 / NBRC 15988 / NCIMB 1366 / Fx l1 / Sio-4) TaxID=880071 RepID=I4AP50_BERLS|nr:type III-B CRISPR module-associated protein Cmr3 [Bernardetia litoralis]AFM05735.1 CRISPR-associated protein, Cmr3 family [Bernardetia litoralis DSM 6794]